jgi:hypothetical protein
VNAALRKVSKIIAYKITVQNHFLPQEFAKNSNAACWVKNLYRAQSPEADIFWHSKISTIYFVKFPK